MREKALRQLMLLRDGLHDLAADPAHVNRRAAHFQRLRALQRELADPLDLTATFPNL